MDWDNAISAADVELLSSLEPRRSSAPTGTSRTARQSSHSGPIHAIQDRRRARIEREDASSAVLQAPESKASADLRRCSRMGDLPGVMRAVGDGAKLNSGDEKGRTALHFAATSGGKAIVRYLAGQGADPNVKDSNGNTALHLAACTSNIGIITALLEAGCAITSVDAKGRTPLEFALSHLSIINRYRSDSAQYRKKIQDIVDLLRVYIDKKHVESELDFDEISAKLSLGGDGAFDEVEALLTTFMKTTLNA